MDFNKESKELISVLLPEMESYISKKHNKKIQNNIDELAMTIYHKIQMAEVSYASIVSRGLIKSCTLEKEFTKPYELLKSTFIPSYIYERINNDVKHVAVYNFNIGARQIQVDILLHNHIRDTDYEELNKVVKKIYIWLHVVNKMALKSCSKKLNIQLYLGETPKVSPENLSEILGPIHANGAVTNVCSYKNDILIFRKEEWFKVFIHETFHALGMDFSSMNDIILRTKLLILFPIKTSMDVSEAYSEFWATIMNCMFCSYYMTHKSIEDPSKRRVYSENKAEYLEYVDLCITIERVFSMFQCVKVLHHMGLTYNMLFSRVSTFVSMRKLLYREDTNIFSYYIIKCILLYNYGDFITWCKNNNNLNTLRFTKTKKNLCSLYEFIESKYNDNEFMDNLNEMYLFYDTLKRSIRKIKPQTHCVDTMRMSICEVSH